MYTEYVKNYDACIQKFLKKITCVSETIIHRCSLKSAEIYVIFSEKIDIKKACLEI